MNSGAAATSSAPNKISDEDQSSSGTAANSNAGANSSQSGSKLPQTGSELPLLGLIGMGTLSAGVWRAYFKK
jgi:LPXTG-motif cell wall-anchored protein